MPRRADSTNCTRAAARDGDRFAQDALYRRHSKRAAALAARLLASSQDVEDVLHDAFLEALTTLDALREPAAFRPWLLRIVVSCVRQRMLRRGLLRRLGLHRSGDDVSLEAQASASASPEHLAELSLVDDVLRRQPVDDRIAWKLRRVEGYSIDEVAELCAVSATTVKRRVGRLDRRVARLVEVDS